jgi:hypothetical protein
MERRLMAVRVWLGVDVERCSESHDGIHLQGQTRLVPGQIIEVARTGDTDDLVVRRALVCTWKIRAMGSHGPVYHGFCAWR